MTAQNIILLENKTENKNTLSLSEKLYILACGGQIVHKKSGFKIWANDKSGKLDSDTRLWVSSLPSIIFNNDIEFYSDNHL